MMRNAVLFVVKVITLGRDRSQQMENKVRNVLRRYYNLKGGERWQQRSRDEQHCNIRTILEIRLKRSRFAGFVIRTEDHMSIRDTREGVQDMRNRNQESC